MTRLCLLLLAAILFPLSAEIYADDSLPERDLGRLCDSTNSHCSPLTLDGLWGLQKGRLVDALPGAGVPTVRVPGTWSPVPFSPWNPQWSEAQDIGTYGLILRNVPPLSGLALQLSGVHSSYRVLWKPLMSMGASQVLFEMGWNHADPMQSESSLRDDIVPLPLLADKTDYILTIQVANPKVAKGGLRTAPRLGLSNDFYQEQVQHTLLFGVLIGSMLIIAFYHLLIYRQRRSDTSALWLAIQCFSIAAHTASTQGFLSLIWPAPSDIVVLIRTWLAYIPHIIAPVAFYAFLIEHFPGVRHTSARYIFGIPSVASIGLLFTPLWFISRLYMTVYVPIMVVFIGFIFWRCLVAARSDRGFRWVINGIALLGLASINDALIGSGIIQSWTLLPWAEVTFIMMQGALLSKSFARAYKVASRLSLELDAEVKRQTREIRSILDTIQQGILTVQGYDLTVGTERSRYLTQHFLDSEQAPSFAGIMNQAVELSHDRQSQIQEALRAILDEDSLAYDINIGLLPNEMSFRTRNQDRVFEIDWSPIPDAQGVTSKVLMCLRDVSEIRILRQQSRQNEEDLRIMGELLNIPEERFKTFIARMNHYLNENQSLMEVLEDPLSLDRKEAIRQIFMNIHTIKGNARTLHLQAIAAASHDLEHEIAILLDASVEQDLNPFKTRLEQVISVIDRYQNVSLEKLGWDMHEDRVRVPKHVVLKCSHVLGMLPENLQLPDVVLLERELQKYCPSDVAHVISDVSRGLDSIARDLKKIPPKIQVDAPSLMLTESGQQLIQGLFTHVLRNAVDHGLEEPQEREARGKNPQGTIQIATEIGEGFLEITCHDDGRGLNVEKIKRKATDLGLLNEQSRLNTQGLAELIFSPSLSTAEAVTKISGRGVGMDAVRSFLEKVGGTARIKLLGPVSPEGYVPFALVLVLPQDFWWSTRTMTPSLSQSA